MSYMKSINDSVGESATLEVVSDDGVTKYGDKINESTTTRTITATFEVLSNEAEEVREGDFDAGDLRVYIPTSVSDVAEGNRIVYQNTTYQIDAVEKNTIGNQEHYEVRCGQV